MPTDDTITLSGTPTQTNGGARVNTVIPRRLGHVSLVRELGQGGMGTVWLARDEMLGRDVAVKFLLNAVTDADDPGFARFLEGARAAATLRHPGLTAIHAVELINGVPYQVMEYVEGPTVAAVLERHGPLSPSVAHAIIDAVADAIGVLHERGIVHHDIKPSNVLLDTEGHVFVTDFGLTCRRATADTKMLVSGTPVYMAPEMFDGQVSPKSDVYALGVMLYEMLTGERPFRRNLSNTTQRVEREALPREPLAMRNVPVALIEVIERAVNVNPLFRHKSAASFRQAVDEAMGSRTDAIRDGRVIAALVARAEDQAEAAPIAEKTTGESTPTYFDSLSQIAAKKRGATALEAIGGTTAEDATLRPVAPLIDPYPTGRLPEDRCIPCIKCGYDLRGQRTIGRCPECGVAIEDSAQSERLVFSPNTWLRRIVLGMKILRYSFAAIIIAFAAPFTLTLLRIFPGDWIMKSIGWVMLGAASVGPAVGVWLSTATEPDQPPNASALRRKWVPRGAILLNAAYVIFIWKSTDIASFAVNAILSIGLSAAHCAGTILYGWAIAAMIARIPEPKLARELYNSSVVMGILLATLPMMVLVMPWMKTPAVIVIIVTVLGLIMYWGRLGTCERALRQVIRLQGES